MADTKQTNTAPVPGVVTRSSRGTIVTHVVTERGTKITYVRRAVKGEKTVRKS